VKICRQCGSRFSGDARFCPFDAEPLGPALGSEEVRDPLLGVVVDDRYEVQGVLGEGGMGTVYRVRHCVIERPFALKVLRADLASDANLGLRFLREAKAAASISHPSVVQITDFGTLPSGQPYFVMELLAGESLSALIGKGGPLPAARAVRLLDQMIDALAAAHAAGVVHRDLKPDNILICPSPGGGETLKVLDFGLAKVAGQSRLTKAGLVFGTPHYMSPEQASGGTVDERTDVYALGVVMYEMFTGRVPFEADTYMGVLTKHLYVAPTPPSVHLGGVAELGALEQMTLCCLEKRPERRYPSMLAVGKELSRVATLRDDGSLVVEPAELRARRALPLADELELPSSEELALAMARAGVSKRHLPALAISGALAVALALLAGAWWFRGNPSIAGHRSAPPVVAPSPGPARGPATNPAPAPRAPSVVPSVAPSGPATDQRGPLSSAAEDRGVGPVRTRISPRAASAPPARTEPAEGAGNQPKRKENRPDDEIVDPWSR
jgi:serine/threonine-protein kinase